MNGTDSRILIDVPVSELADGLVESLGSLIEDQITSGLQRSRLPEFIRTKTATKLFGLSDMMLRNMRQRGRISYHKEGTAVLYRTEDLRRELDAQRIPHTLNGITNPT